MPLTNRGGFIFRIIIIGHPIFSVSLCGGKLPDSCLLKNSVGKCRESSGESGVSTDEYVLLSPGARWIMILFISSTVLFSGVKIAEFEGMLSRSGKMQSIRASRERTMLTCFSSVIPFSSVNLPFPTVETRYCHIQINT